MSTAATPFGALLRKYRLAAGLTQEALAERAGLSVRNIQNLEHGTNQPLRGTMSRLAVALALGPDEQHSFLAAASVTPRQRPPAGAAAQLPEPFAHTLPVSPTALLGREGEVAAVVALLQREDVRLLTLVGPGGVGKTRLAMQVGCVLQEHYADGVVFVDLAPLDDASLVLPTIAGALGVVAQGQQPPQVTLASYLHAKHMLLLVDNVEQVAAAAPEVAALRAACPGLRVLATSRALLGVQGEHAYAVPPLAVPDPRRLPPHDQLSQVAAIALFVQRARAHTPGFTLSPANAAAVAEICARLDGLPLAIELAAARVRVLPPRALLARLDHPLQVLTGGASDLPARQQTLRRTIGWSYDLLSPAEQTLFRRLAVFADGCALEAVEAVCRPWPNKAADDPLTATDMLDTLDALLAGSLLGMEEQADGAPRFRLLTTIREYGLEQVEATGETAALRRRHALYYLALAREAEPCLVSAEQSVWLDRLDREIDNLRAALSWCVERGKIGDDAALDEGLWVAGTFVPLLAHARPRR